MDKEYILRLTRLIRTNTAKNQNSAIRKCLELVF